MSNEIEGINWNYHGFPCSVHSWDTYAQLYHTVGLGLTASLLLIIWGHYSYFTWIASECASWCSTVQCLICRSLNSSSFTVMSIRITNTEYWNKLCFQEVISLITHQHEIRRQSHHMLRMKRTYCKSFS